MTNRYPLLALTAALLLSACNNESHTLVEQGPVDPMANELANAAPPPPLPIIAASKSYRCAGNEVVEVDWTEIDGKPVGANIRVGKDAIAPVVLAAPPTGTGPYTTADGTSLTGAKGDASINLTLPGESAVVCRG